MLSTNVQQLRLHSVQTNAAKQDEKLIHFLAHTVALYSAIHKLSKKNKSCEMQAAKIRKHSFHVFCALRYNAGKQCKYHFICSIAIQQNSILTSAQKPIKTKISLNMLNSYSKGHLLIFSRANQDDNIAMYRYTP